jgi:HK97 family phage major capsid protein
MSELHEMHSALNALRSEVESKFVRQEVVNRCTEFLDKQEAKNQELVKAANEAKSKAEELESKYSSLEATLARPNLSAKSEEYEMEVKAFKNLVRSGEVETEKKYLRTDVNEDGGFLVPDILVNEVIKNITEISNLRSVARVRAMGNKTESIPTRTTIVSVGMVGEGQEDALSNSKYGLEKLVAKTAQVTIQATLQELQDSSIDITTNINEDVAEALAQLEGAQFVNGSGAGNNCEGFMTNASVTSINTGSASALTFDSLIALTGELKTGYNPLYAFNRKTLANIRTLKDGNGHYIWQAGNLGAGIPNAINGYNYIELPDMPDIAANAFPVIFADFRRGYIIGDRLGMTMLRDPYSKKREGKVEFTFTKRFAGGVVLAEAFKKLKVST